MFFALFTQHTPFNFDIFYKWGILIALFGTVIPPMLLNAGFPLTGIGLGSIVSALELPVSVMMAYVLLNETVVGKESRPLIQVVNQTSLAVDIIDFSTSLLRAAALSNVI